jgi:glutaredoxin 2
MALGLLNLNFESVVLAYDDEQTPTKLTGKKMLPILRYDRGVINESLDIINFLDKENFLKTQERLSGEEFKHVETLLEKIGKPVHSLAMPYWIFTPEFTPASRKYFQTKKEEKRGSFTNLVKRRDEFINEINTILSEIEKDLHPFYKSETLTLFDILIAAHLWGLYIVPEYQFPLKIHHYLQSVKKICRFEYHSDFWSDK